MNNVFNKYGEMPYFHRMKEILEKREVDKIYPGFCEYLLKKATELHKRLIFPYCETGYNNLQICENLAFDALDNPKEETIKDLKQTLIKVNSDWEFCISIPRRVCNTPVPSDSQETIKKTLEGTVKYIINLNLLPNLSLLTEKINPSEYLDYSSALNDVKNSLLNLKIPFYKIFVIFLNYLEYVDKMFISPCETAFYIDSYIDISFDALNNHIDSNLPCDKDLTANKIFAQIYNMGKLNAIGLESLLVKNL